MDRPGVSFRVIAEHAGLRTIVGIVIGSGFAMPASPEELAV
jgi:hypothetical protein